MTRFIIGIDEAGRGPLAGPVSVGAVKIAAGFDVLKAFPDVKDSKVMTAKKRDEVFEEASARAAAGELEFCVRFSEHSIIDELGITRAVRRAVEECVSALSPSAEGVHIVLDGLLHAPAQYAQETIIRGDALVPVISLASVVAKVSRDRLMEKYAQQFPDYGFERHKGYGTSAHYVALGKFGLCPIHRLSYCKGLLQAAKSV